MTSADNSPAVASTPSSSYTQDVSYTINHALSCTVLDQLNTPVQMLSQHYLGTKIRVSYCPACEDGTHSQTVSHKGDSLGSRAGRWMAAELIGDWLAVIPTVAAQRYAPHAMQQMGDVLSYSIGPVFRYGAHRSAQSWAKEQHLRPDAPEVTAKAEALYDHEIHHLPQAAVWTVSSTALTLGALRALGDRYTHASNATAKIIGASTSIAGVLGTRALAPDTAQRWDSWTQEQLFTPATRIITDGLGLENTVHKQTQVRVF